MRPKGITMSDLMTSVCVRYKYVDGWHVFSSDDVAGLYVASTDAEKAFNDIGPSIELLLKLNEGIECVVKPEFQFSEFLRATRQLHQPERRAKKSPRVSSSLGLSDRLFAIYPAALAA